MHNNFLIGLLKFREMKKIFLELEKFQYALIKGEALSLQAYNKTGMRHSGDIDILINKRDITKVKSLFYSHGFEEGNNKTREEKRKEDILSLVGSHQVVPLKKDFPFGKIEIDLNFDIFWGQYKGKRIEISELLSHVNSCSIYGCDVKVLEPLYSLIQLVLHHYKEMNSIYHITMFNTIKKDMLLDVYYLIKNNEEIITPNLLSKICEDYNIKKYAFYVLYYTNYIMKDKLLDTYLEQLYDADIVKILNRFGLKDNEYHYWKTCFKDRLDCDNLAEIVFPQLSKNSIENIIINNKVYNQIELDNFKEN